MYRTGLMSLSVLALMASAVVLWPEAAAQQVPDGRALLIVKLPADAVLTIDTAATKQTGASRKFVSPPLQAGKSYFYMLRASWSQGGQKYEATRKVPVQPGAQVEVDLKAGAVAVAGKGKVTPPAGSPKARTFQFAYAAKVTDLPPGKTARIWLPLPPTNEQQDVDIVEMMGVPENAQTGREKEYGNKMISFEAKAEPDGQIPVTIIYKVTRREVVAPAKDDGAKEQMARFLQPDKLVPLEGRPLELIKDKALPIDDLAMGKLLYDVVDDHMKYSKEGKGWGRGDVLWACDSKYGNCTDFHSLFIALARAQRIPAKFEMGFPLPPTRGEGNIGGYHCWAWFKPKTKGWMAVDISEADKDPKMKEYYFGNLTEDRTQFTTGRDIDLVPKQEGPSLNYFIYPYVEVDGKPYDKVERKFGYKDQ